MDITRIAPPQPFKALIFDCDGTLADTMPNHFKAWAASLQSFGADLTEENFYRMGGWPNQAIIEDLNREFGYGLDIEKTQEDKEASLPGDCCTPSEEIKAVADIARAHHGQGADGGRLQRLRAASSGRH